MVAPPQYVGAAVHQGGGTSYGDGAGTDGWWAAAGDLLKQQRNMQTGQEMPDQGSSL